MRRTHRLTCQRCGSGAPGRRVLVPALVCAVFVATLAGPAVAQTSSAPVDAPTTTTTVAKERTRQEQTIVEAAIRLYKLRAELAGVVRELADVSDRLVVAERALAETETELATVRAELAEVRRSLEGRAVLVYRHHSDRLSMALSVGRVVDLAAGTRYAQSVAVVDNREIASLEAVIADLEAKWAQQDAVRRELADQKVGLERTQADLQATVDREQAAIDQLGGVAVLGAPLLSAEEIAAWFKSTGQRARLMGNTTIDDLTEMYVSEGLAENVRGDLAFAQAVLETGSFGHAADNNFAGIGHCDSCDDGYLFPSPRDGVRAQIQLLRNYADPFSRADLLKNPLDPTLHGTDPARAAHAFDSFSHKGRAPVWNVMGAGNWATDPLYAGKVLNIYARMLAFKAG